jgi:hypothetical protein
MSSNRLQCVLWKWDGQGELIDMCVCVLRDRSLVRRVLANRQSAARSKERKMRYIAELEHKVQVLQSEAKTLSAQLTLLQVELLVHPLLSTMLCIFTFLWQRNSAGIATQNNELKFRIQAMEQQAQLRDGAFLPPAMHWFLFLAVVFVNVRCARH